MIVTNSLTGGGAERSMNLVANELTKRGWPVALVPINSGPSDLVIPTCEVFPLERKWQSGTLETFRSIVKFNQLVNSWKPDLIILNCDLPELFGSMLVRKSQLIVLEHASNPWMNRIFLGRKIRLILKLRKTTWIAVSSHLSIWPNEMKPSAVLQNPIALSAKSIPLLQSEQIKRLIFVGRLSPEKRPGWFMEICKRTKLPGLIIGDGAMRAAMEESVRLEGLHIDFVGQITDPWRSLKEGDLLIVPSEFEGDGLVVIEGLAFGIPMLVADIPDFRRFGFSDRNYCIDISDFENRCKNFHTEIASLIVSSEITKNVLDTRSIDNVGLAWEKLLRRL